MAYELLRILEDVERESQGPIQAHVAPRARRVFGHKGHAAPIMANDPRIVEPTNMPAPSTSNPSTRDRLRHAQGCTTAEQYAKMMSLPVERGDKDHVIRAHQASLDHYANEWNLWHRSGMINR